MSKKEITQKLNDQLNREVSTFLRYMLQAASIKGAQHETVRDMYLKEVTDEVGHAQYLANQIAALGERPTITPDLTTPPTRVEDMLRNDIEAEQSDVRNYVQLSELAEKAGMIALKLQMEEQAADEDSHAQEMRRLLG